MALLFFVFLGVSLADEAGQSCHLLQTASEARRKKSNQTANLVLQPLAATKNQGICLAQLTQQEWSQPTEKVVSTYGQDGWCLYGSMGTWCSECAKSRKSKDIAPYIEQYESSLVTNLNGAIAQPVTLRLPDKRTLTTRDHYYPLDDLYCFLNGWYLEDKGDQRAKFLNFSYLEEVSDRDCNKLKEQIPEYHSLSVSDMSDESEVDENWLSNAVNGDGTLDVPESVVRGMKVHAAVKCLLRGGGHGAAVCDISNCAARACLGEGNVVHYTQRGECQKLT